ncbi:MAG TPA: Trm112 family protein [Candidatus Polarisedimenticolia bacterium]|nr:Trm112 family protein [Candidatus Polarisedimenticolia bacterium]
MSLDPSLLEILACPLCKTEVSLTPDGSGLVCRTCRRCYPIVDDVPIMLVEKATVLPEDRP